jgi:hypothetical protein
MEVDGEGTCSKEDMMEVDFASDLENGEFMPNMRRPMFLHE